MTSLSIKWSLLLLFVLSLSGNMYAQRPDKNELRASFIQLPHKPLPEAVKTYQVKILPGDISFMFIHLNKPMAYVETGTSNNYGSVEKAEADFLQLPGYEKVAAGGDVSIQVVFRKLDPKDKVMKTGIGTFTESKQTVTRTMYYYEFAYSYFAAAYITTAAGDTVYQKVYTDKRKVRARYGSCGDCKQAAGGSHENFGASYTSELELEDSFKKRFLMDEQNTWTRDALLDLKNYLFNNVGKPFVYRDFDWISGKGGKQNYADLDTAISRMRIASDRIAKSRGEIDQAKPLIQEAISIWEKALEESNPADKKARINEDITAGLHYNLSLAHAFLREFDKSRLWASKATVVKDGQKLMRNVQPWIDDQEKRLKANGKI